MCGAGAAGAKSEHGERYFAGQQVLPDEASRLNRSSSGGRSRSRSRRKSNSSGLSKPHLVNPYLIL